MSKEFGFSLYNSSYKHPLVGVSKEDWAITEKDLLIFLKSVIPNCDNYLEIGCDSDATFSFLKPKFKMAVGVNYVSGGTLKMSSDDYFKSVDLPQFDLIFIDGLHLYKQVIKEIQSSLKILSPSGMIVIHDCKPRDEKEACPIQPLSPQLWNGDVWKAALWARCQPDLDCATLNADWGSMVIMKRPNSDPILDEVLLEKLTWDDYVKHQNKWLRSLSFANLKKWVINSKETYSYFEKCDKESPVKLLVVSNNMEFVGRVSKIPYGNVQIYLSGEIEKLKHKTKANVIWTFKDGTPQELAELAEREYLSLNLIPEKKPFPLCPIKVLSISIFTVSENPLLLERSYRSLLSQTFPWTWNILLTSGDKVFEDDRVRVLKSDNEDAKFTIASTCRGDVLLQLEPGDELLPDSLNLLAKAYESPSNPIFVYGNYVETTDLSPTKTLYHDVPFAHGYGRYQYEKHPELGWVAVASGITINETTCKYPTALPFYCLSWRKDFYQFIGGFSKLPVGENYELMLRTVRCGPTMNIPQMLYVHYINKPILPACFHRISKIIYSEFKFPPNLTYHEDKTALLINCAKDKETVLKLIKNTSGIQEVLLAGSGVSWLNDDFLSEVALICPNVKWWNSFSKEAICTICEKMILF